MGKVTLKAYVNPKSLASKISATIATKFIAPKFNKETLVFTIGNQNYKGRRADPSDIDSEVICEVPGTDFILSDKNTAIPINHDMIIDKSDPTQKFIYDMILHSGIVAGSKAEVNPTAGHSFYIQDEDLEAHKVSSKADLTYEALEVIREMNMEEKVDLARMMGQYVLRMTDNQINGFVKDTSMSNPSKILSTIADKDYKHRVFLKRLQDANILRYDNGKYLYHEQLIGVDMDHVVAFVKDPKNAPLVTNWGRLLNDGNVVDVSEEVVMDSIKSTRNKKEDKNDK